MDKGRFLIETHRSTGRHQGAGELTMGNGELALQLAADIVENRVGPLSTLPHRP
jgi:hypothetical protein